MTARDHAAGALVVRRQPGEEMFLPSGEALGCHRDPRSTWRERETGGRHIEGGQIVLLDDRERARELPIVAALQDDHARKLREHHEGRRPLRRFLVPPWQGRAGGVHIRPHGALHQAPEQQCQQQDEPQGFDAFWLLQKETIDQHWVFEKPVVLLKIYLLMPL